MIRMQVQLTREQTRKLREWAKAEAISFSEAVRICVDVALGRRKGTPSRKEQIESALKVCGKYRDTSGVRDVASEHDRYLAQAYRE